MCLCIVCGCVCGLAIIASPPSYAHTHLSIICFFYVPYTILVNLLLCFIILVKCRFYLSRTCPLCIYELLCGSQHTEIVALSRVLGVLRGTSPLSCLASLAGSRVSCSVSCPGRVTFPVVKWLHQTFRTWSGVSIQNATKDISSVPASVLNRCSSNGNSFCFYILLSLKISSDGMKWVTMPLIYEDVCIIC